MFLYREKELELLENDLSMPNSSFNMIFGRRYIGKTAFLNEYTKSKMSFYISFNETINLIAFKNIHQNLEKFVDAKIDNFDDFSSFLSVISKIKFDEKLILVFDDFQNLVKVEKDSLSKFYKAWIKELSNTNIQILISTSVCSSNKDDEYIYKKASNKIILESLPYTAIKKLMPEVENGELMHIYSAYGTTPKYLKTYNSNKDFLLNLKENFLDHTQSFFNEGIDFLKKDLNDIATYSSILYAIALGHNKIGDIASFLDLKSTYLTRYMQKLIDIMIIKKYVPINDDEKRSKFGRYEIEDNFIKFWYCYIFPNQSTLLKNDTYSVISYIRNDFTKSLVRSAYKKHIFELVSDDPYKFFGFIPSKIGRWWNNKDIQIDLVAYDSKNIIFADSKWRDNQKIELSYTQLKSKSTYFKTILNKKYIIFSKIKPQK